MLCGCGCGKETKIAPRNHSKRGWAKNQPQKFLTGHGLKKGKQHRDRTKVVYEVDPDTGCWNWLLFRNHKGYGRWYYNGKKGLAHRLIYEMLRGEIPTDQTLDHLCNNTSCVNPDHMELTSAKENSRRKNGVFDKCLSLNFIVIRAINEWKKFCRSPRSQTLQQQSVVPVAA